VLDTIIAELGKERSTIMSFNIGGLPVNGIIADIVKSNREVNEQALNQMIQEAKNDPTKTIREIQQPSPFSQFLDIKI